MAKVTPDDKIRQICDAIRALLPEADRKMLEAQSLRRKLATLEA